MNCRNHVEINSLGSNIHVRIGGQEIENVCSYEIKSSATHPTELVLTIIVTDGIKVEEAT